MKKSELKNGMIVETKQGKYYLVIDDRIVGMNGFLILKKYNDDLTYDNNYLYREDFEIIKVFCKDGISSIGFMNRLDFLKYKIWERKEIDWNKVKKDSVIYIRSKVIGHFAKHEGDSIYVYKYGRTSKTTINEYYAKYNKNEVELVEEF